MVTHGYPWLTMDIHPNIFFCGPKNIFLVQKCLIYETNIGSVPRIQFSSRKLRFSSPKILFPGPEMFIYETNIGCVPKIQFYGPTILFSGPKIFFPSPEMFIL